jgi:hypothetical protein
MDELKYIEKLDLLISEFVDRSKMFVNTSCYLPGLKDILDKQRTIRHVYDHEYLAFTKSVKTLISIKNLLELGNNEDVYILARSIFENYLAARYLNENVLSDEDIPKLDEYIHNRIKISLGYYSVKYPNVLDESGKQVSKLKSIKSQLVGLDKLYYSDLYGFLSRFTHLDFSNLDYYVDETASFVINKDNDSVLVRLVTIFVITKLFETIVTVEGEDFYDLEEEKKCYKVVKDSLRIQREIFKKYIKFLEGETNNTAINLSRANMRNMLNNLNLSLEDTIGSLDKEFLIEHSNS